MAKVIKIYDIEVWGTKDMCGECFETIQLSPFFPTREQAEEELAKLRGKRSELECKANADFHDNAFEIEETELVLPDDMDIIRKPQQ